MTTARSGVLLIIVAALAAILATLGLTFLSMARNEGDELAWAARYTQARIMLHAGCAYVQETARIGWDRQLGDGSNEEAYGWVDVRGGIRDRAAFASRMGRAPTAAEEGRFPIGPRSNQDLVTESGASGADGIYDAMYATTLAVDGNGDGIADRPLWPAIGSVVRCPMQRLERPPFAITQTVAPNAIANDPSDPAFGLPLLIKPDPEPLFGPGVTAASTASARWLDWSRGDVRPRAGAEGQAWVRIHRDGPATFVITCGAGASEGFRDWDEVRGLGEQALFQSNQDIFDQIVADEIRLWYRIEWSPAIAGNPPVTIDWRTLQLNPQGGGSADNVNQQPWARVVNQGGTIQWIQRLRAAPAVW
ncbi:MAG: hypothetical protein PF961_07060 [Planctomycetota bacterium]|jgi:hypothetical protein|nr:hypothetical protein [Planctomycetota bacterium]